MQRSRKNKGEIQEIKNTDETELIIQEQKKFIEILKNEKYRLEQRLAVLENDRNCVLNVLDITQKNAEEIIRQAKTEASTILKAAQKEAELIKNSANSYIRDMLNVESTLDGIVHMVQALKSQVREIEDNKIEESGISA
jgi:cell division septum initiation protein DivIVA